MISGVMLTTSYEYRLVKTEFVRSGNNRSCAAIKMCAANRKNPSCGLRHRGKAIALNRCKDLKSRLSLAELFGGRKSVSLDLSGEKHIERRFKHLQGNVAV
jgi:hypothetical protein